MTRAAWAAILCTALGPSCSTTAYPTPDPGSSPFEQSAPVPPPANAQWFVAAAGAPHNDGTRGRPWDLATALAHPPSVHPGDTIWLRGGTYPGPFRSHLTGTPSAPITVRGFPRERATLVDQRRLAQGATLTVAGAWTIYQDFEVENENPDRSSPNALDLFRPMGLEITAPHSAFVNLVVHDTGHGFGLWSEAEGALLYGNLVYNCGLQNVPGNLLNGHAIYAQNDQGEKALRDNLLLNQFGWGIHLVPGPGPVSGFDIEGNVLSNNGVLSENAFHYNNLVIHSPAASPAARIRIAGNYFYDFPRADQRGAPTDANLCLGCGDTRPGLDVALVGNLLVGGSPIADLAGWQSVTASGNAFVGTTTLASLAIPTSALSGPYSWDWNAYFRLEPAFSPFSFLGAAGTAVSGDFDIWRAATGFDRHSTYSTGRPPGALVAVRPNAFEPGRAHVIVFNWDLADTVAVDLSHLLAPGARYQIRDAANYFGPPVAAGTFTGAPIPLPMRDLPVAAPVGWDPAPPTGPELNVFVVLPDP